MKKYILLALFVLTLAGGAGWMRRIGVSDGPTSGVQPPRPSPIDERLARPPVRVVAAGESVRTRVADTVQAAEKAPSGKELAGNDWAVVVAIYKDHAAADRRARSLSTSSRYKALVFPPEGQGTKYMVILEDGLTHGAATQIRDQAVAGGLPADTYVTRLSYRQ
ncbi:MAG TPA: hypothetical protein VER03_21185 [Bryobacteraceae bacterium]|nr:hypothetical protein [Bryobacteraceae bacterium]